MIFDVYFLDRVTVSDVLRCDNVTNVSELNAASLFRLEVVSTLKMEIACFYETSVFTRHTLQAYSVRTQKATKRKIAPTKT
jgi:hypothetical protein